MLEMAWKDGIMSMFFISVLTDGVRIFMLFLFIFKFKILFIQISLPSARAQSFSFSWIDKFIFLIIKDTDIFMYFNLSVFLS